MQIPMNFIDAEKHTISLCLSIQDSVCEAGADAEKTLQSLHAASAFAHTLARFLDNLSRGIQGEVPVFEDHATTSPTKITPICTVRGDGVA